MLLTFDFLYNKLMFFIEMKYQFLLSEETHEKYGLMGFMLIAVFLFCVLVDFLNIISFLEALIR